MKYVNIMLHVIDMNGLYYYQYVEMNLEIFNRRYIRLRWIEFQNQFSLSLAYD